MSSNGSRLVPPLPATIAERLVSPLQQFGRLQSAGGILLLACAAAAMVIANSPWEHAYHEALKTTATVGVGSWALTLSIEQWINDALMATFFFVVGLEIKREVLVGELSSLKKAAVPVIAALGGMIAPAIVFLIVDWGKPTVRGWGVPTATDIAFALGAIALLGKRVPTGLRIFIATLAIADDIGALVLIAVFYAENLSLSYLVGAGVCVGVMLALSAIHVRRAWVYGVVGLVLWYFVLKSGVHATIAGVLGAMAIPVKTRVDGAMFAGFAKAAVAEFERAGGRSEDPRGIVTNPDQQAAVQGIEDACNKVQTPLHQLEHAMAPWVAFLVIPIFALANAGVSLHGDLVRALTSPETIGVALGLVIGKPLGITLASLIAVKVGLGQLPDGVSWRQLHGGAWLGGIGFTMSLFIAHLAFPDQTHLNNAKIGIMAGSLIAAIMGFVVLGTAGKANGK